MSDLYFLSFADKRYASSMLRLQNEVYSFPFSKYFFYTENNLPGSYKRNLRYKMHRRGFGYWKWKSFIVKRLLTTMQEGDILVYSDCGVHWNKYGMKRFEEYVEMLKCSKENILAFQQPYLEKDYTKGDLLYALNAYDNEKLTMTLQLWAGVFFIKKTTESIRIVDCWFDICHNQYDLITDKISNQRNLKGFIENRHNQSIFSLIVKLNSHIEIPFEEVESLDGNWERMNEYPIQGRRLIHEQKSLLESVRKKLWNSFGFLICLYLMLFENMSFRAKYPCW